MCGWCMMPRPTSSTSASSMLPSSPQSQPPKLRSPPLNNCKIALLLKVFYNKSWNLQTMYCDLRLLTATSRKADPMMGFNVGTETFISAPIQEYAPLPPGVSFWPSDMYEPLWVGVVLPFIPVYSVVMNAIFILVIKVYLTSPLGVRIQKYHGASQFQT
jgi:hypothetical protein